jgi:hypothetical protein
MPGWPLFAACTASMESALMALASDFSETVIWAGVFPAWLSGPLLSRRIEIASPLSRCTQSVNRGRTLESAKPSNDGFCKAKTLFMRRSWQAIA